MEFSARVYQNKDEQVIKEIVGVTGIQKQNKILQINSLVGRGNTKINCKDNIAINENDNLAEILQANCYVLNKEFKTSYNKILVKAESVVKIMYLTEENTINNVEANIPVMGFIDIPNVSEDNMYFADNSLIDLADKFNKQGGRHLFIDEIHKYPNWSRELKQIFDSYPDMQILFTGSSILDIYKGTADLSRRAPIYEMQGLSFREYLSMFHQIHVPVYTLEEILEHKVEIPGIAHPLPLFSKYLQYGYYPFGKDVTFEIELNQVINQTMENDIPQYANMNVSTGRKLKQLLMIISKNISIIQFAQ